MQSGEVVTEDSGLALKSLMNKIWRMGETVSDLSLKFFSIFFSYPGWLLQSQGFSSSFVICEIYFASSKPCLVPCLDFHRQFNNCVL